jgi:hypothetical protein
VPKEVVGLSRVVEEAPGRLVWRAGVEERMKVKESAEFERLVSHRSLLREMPGRVTREGWSVAKLVEVPRRERHTTRHLNRVFGIPRDLTDSVLAGAHW